VLTRYSDFVVNEIGLDGEPVTLKSTTYTASSNGAEKPKVPPLRNFLMQVTNTLDLTPLSDLFTAEQISQLESMYLRSDSAPTELTTSSDLTKEQRTSIHHTIRLVFHSKLETQATPANAIRITRPAHVSHRRQGPKWPQGEYLHFILKKNNRDTMATASLLAKWLKIPGKMVGYAGTKDRRAVTSQRVSVCRVLGERLAAVNKVANPMGIWLGDFKYERGPVKLGELKGNEFIVTLREVPLQTDLGQVERGVSSLREMGFINYYGMQRFGTSLVSTHFIGALLLNGQWKEVCEAILDVRAGGMNDSLDAREMYVTGDVAGALERMPRSCLAERAVLTALKKSPNSYLEAIHAVLSQCVRSNADSEKSSFDVCTRLPILYMEHGGLRPHPTFRNQSPRGGSHFRRQRP
jgi:tRNA pseudouridine13 synthase